MKFAKKLLVPLVLYGGLFVFLISTNPHELSIGFLLIPFVWVFTTLFWTIRVLLRRLKPDTRPKRATLLAITGAALPTMALLLDSINQLTLRDGVLFIAFAVVGFFYIGRINFSR